DPASFYPDTGISIEELRPLPHRFPELARPEGRVSPVKGFIPVYVGRPNETETFYRFHQRGPILEAEILETDAFRSILTLNEAELLAGQLLRWKLAGALHLQLEMA